MNPAAEVEALEQWAEGSPDADVVRRNGRIAGALFITGGIAGTPAILFEDPGFPPSTFLLTLLAVCSGLVCLALPWERISSRWFHLVAVIATLEVALVAGLVDPVFSWYFVLIAVYSAYVFPTRLEVAAQVGFICGVMLAPTVVGLGDAYSVVDMLVAIPTVIVATGIVVTLSEGLQRGKEGYRFLSRRDPLTGVGNYRELHDVLVGEIDRHRRADRRFALIVLDLDGFKEINDAVGHLTGDRVLREVGQALLQAVRPGDTVARHGGDEFSVIAPETSADEAANLALRLEQAIPRVVAGEQRLSASTGWAIYPDQGQDPDSLLAEADDSIKREKQSRREVRHGALGPSPRRFSRTIESP